MKLIARFSFTIPSLAAKNAKTLQGEPVQISFKNGKVNVNEASLVSADIKASNGVIHVIDSVILPPEAKNDIASVAKKASKFNTLLAAVDAAGLSGLLAGKDNLTVFAPTDAAFKALPKGTVESLLKPENRSKLKGILTLHVVSGKVSAGSALNAKSAKALSGEKLNFAIFRDFEEHGIQFSLPFRHSFWKRDDEQGALDVNLLREDGGPERESGPMVRS